MDKKQQPVSTGYGQQDFSPAENGFNKWLFSLWDGRFLIIGSVATFLVLGGLYIWRAVPLYQASAMIQIQTKRVPVSGDNLSRVDTLFAGPTSAVAESEILTSSQLLGKVVGTLSYDLEIEPKTFPVIGKALLRHRENPPKLEMDAFSIPDDLRGRTMVLTALPDGAFALDDPSGELHVKGMVGQEVAAMTTEGKTVLKVRALRGNPGQKFRITKLPLSQAVERLRGHLGVGERGRQTNVLGLTFTDPSPTRSAAVLNEMMQEYIQHYQEKRKLQTDELLAQLEKKMPSVKANVHDSEGRLTGAKSRMATVDASREADMLLQQASSLRAQVTMLRQRRDELLRSYTEQADPVLSLDRQIQMLQSEVARLEGRMRALPLAQREEQQVSRDVQINTNLYAALINDIRQLQIYAASDPGNIVIVDKAHTGPVAVFPNRKLLMVAFLVLGCAVGVGLALLKAIFRRGIEDFRLIESELGIPVLETIPHSETQKVQDENTKKHPHKKPILAVDNTDDLAMEGLRGLRTMLHISMREKRSRAVMITGPSPAIGKSFISTNLVVLLAQAGARVLLVDADLRRGCQHMSFGLGERGAGLSDVLAGVRDWRTVLNPIRSAPEEDATKFFSCNLITTGALPRNPSELLLTDRFATFLAEASESYDYIIIDAPPLLSVTDTTLIASVVDDVILVAKYGFHPLEELRACKSRLAKHGIPLMGCVFNDIQAAGFKYLFHPYRYAYQYSYSPKG